MCLLSFLSALIFAHAEECFEVYSMVSDEIWSVVDDTPVTRIINGGTVIVPDFDESCPEELKTPFSYACKLVGEYMPPSLPLRVKVSVASLTGSQRNAISKVSSIMYEYFGSAEYSNSPMATIKGVIL